MNMEAILAMKPDIAIATGGANMKMSAGRIEQQYERVHLPLVFVEVDKISGYPAATDFMGKLLGREKRAKQLSAWARSAFAGVEKMLKAIPPSKRVRVYYAESADGLATESDGSFHADAIKMGGGVIVHKGDIRTHQGMEKVSMEQVLLYNPEVIVSQEPEFAAFAYKDPRWQRIKAVASRRIYTAPRSPFDWIDRPPSVMRIIGVPWAAYMMYPRQYRADIRKQIKEFHKLFMGVSATDADINGWLK
jgi:iron complex transport system substrate-binding protein